MLEYELKANDKFRLKTIFILLSLAISGCSDLTPSSRNSQKLQIDRDWAALKLRHFTHFTLELIGLSRFQMS